MSLAKICTQYIMPVIVSNNQMRITYFLIQKRHTHLLFLCCQKKKNGSLPIQTYNHFVVFGDKKRSVLFFFIGVNVFTSSLVFFFSFNFYHTSNFLPYKQNMFNQKYNLAITPVDQDYKQNTFKNDVPQQGKGMLHVSTVICQ